MQKSFEIQSHLLCDVVQSMKTWKCLKTIYAKYPPKSPRIQRLKFVCTCPTTCPSRTTRTLNSPCWRRTINIQSVFIQRKKYQNFHLRWSLHGFVTLWPSTAVLESMALEFRSNFSKTSEKSQVKIFRSNFNKTSEKVPGKIYNQSLDKFG